MADNQRGDAQDQQAFHEAIDAANIPTLLMVLVHMTGDLGWLAPRYHPTQGRGLDDNDSGGLPEEIQREVREAAFDAIMAWRTGRPMALPKPSEELLVEMLSISMGEPVPEKYGAMIAAGLEIASASGTDRDSQDSIRAPEGFNAIIIGGGISGICAAIRLQKAGIPYTIIEKNETLGGTWFENRYPGAGVDTPNHIYSYSFAPHDWSRYFALRDEIHDYLEQVATDYDLRPQVRFGTHVEAAGYDEQSKSWNVEVRSGNGARETLNANIVISAVGALNVPKTPPIKNLESFHGPCFHTARWPQDLDLGDKRVAVVGNGASAMQVVPAIADRVRHLTVFQRSKQWVAPFEKFQKKVPDSVRFLLREVPLYQAWYRQRLSWTFNDRVHASLQKDPSWPHPERSINSINDGHRKFFTRYIETELGERQDLLSDVLPDYPPFGKRMLLDNGWYRTLTRDNVTLVTDHVAEVDGNRVVAANGEQHEVDVLILATGFKAVNFLGSYTVSGRHGKSLHEAWDGDNARAYLGITVPEFPNFFMMLGPNTGLGHGGSIVALIEAQMGYIMSSLEQMFTKGASTIEVRKDVHDRYNQEVDQAHENMVFTHQGMDNWYRNSRGRVVTITPFRNDDYWHMARQADPQDYRFTK